MAEYMSRSYKGPFTNWASIKYVPREGEGGVGPNEDIVSEGCVNLVL